MPGVEVNTAALMGKKINIIVVVFMALKGTATYKRLSLRLYSEIKNSPTRTY